MAPIDVIGGGLAGCEAAWQLARRGLEVRVREMRPARMTGAHEGGGLAELVCSNSLGSEAEASGGGVLKAELRILGCHVLESADACRVPAGSALAVDRAQLSAEVEAGLERLDGVTVLREEVTDLGAEADGLAVLASGPLTSDELARRLADVTGADNLFFYDAIAPIVSADSLDHDQIFRASRREPDAPGDYLNCPLDEGQYEAFVDRLLEGARTEAHAFEDEHLFEGCQPIESIARKGRESLRFGTMRPVGLDDPRTGRWPHAVVQLRAENAEGTAWGLVGFQTRLKHGAQRALLRSLPGLQAAEFLRLGSIHRNTYVDAPRCLDGELRLKGLPRVRVAGQIAGCEGYVESVALGLMAALWTASEALGRGPLPPPPRETMLGGLLAYLREADRFSPMKANFGLVPTIPREGRKLRRRERRLRMARRAVEAMEAYRLELDRILGPLPSA